MFCLFVFMIIANGVFGVDGDEAKSVSVKEGQSVTLHTDITKLQRYQQIQWIFESQNLIAEIKYGSIYDAYEERFRHRLKLNRWTGSLTITNINNKDSGLYELKIIKSRGVLYKRFNVIVYGVFGDEVKSLSVLEGDSVTLHTDITQVQDDDHIVWMFGPQDTIIAEINKYAKNYSEYTLSGCAYDYDYDYDYEKFGDKLQLDSQTGSLTITNISITNSGLYKLQIANSRGTSEKRFSVSVYKNKLLQPHKLLLMLVGPLLVLLVAGVVIGVVCCFYKKKMNRAREAQDPPVETQLSLIPDVKGSRSQIKEENDACHTPEDLVAEDIL